jgi:hypothetical protein
MDGVIVTQCAQKSFHIGQYAVGGTVKITIEKWFDRMYEESTKHLKVEFLEYKSTEVVQSGLFHQDEMGGMERYISEHSTSYYAGKLMDWVGKEMPIKYNELNRHYGI